MPVLAFLMVVSVAAGVGGPHAFTGGALEYGDQGPRVALLNEQLRDAGFTPDDGDSFGSRTRHAVYAFQKHHSIDPSGSFTPFMWALLDRPITLPYHAVADRVEVDLEKQVLYVVEDRRVVVVLPISSGNGAPYIGSNGRRQIATTPEGEFRFQRRIRGTRVAPLGVLYNPYYFKGGIAVHGSPSVPNHPASHGCVRVTMWDMDLLIDHLSIGQTILVYGVETPRPGARLPADVVRLI